MRLKKLPFVNGVSPFANIPVYKLSLPVCKRGQPRLRTGATSRTTARARLGWLGGGPAPSLAATEAPWVVPLAKHGAASRRKRASFPRLTGHSANRARPENLRNEESNLVFEGSLGNAVRLISDIRSDTPPKPQVTNSSTSTNKRGNYK